MCENRHMAVATCAVISDSYRLYAGFSNQVHADSASRQYRTATQGRLRRHDSTVARPQLPPTAAAGAHGLSVAGGFMRALATGISP